MSMCENLPATVSPSPLHYFGLGSISRQSFCGVTTHTDRNFFFFKSTFYIRKLSYSILYLLKNCTQLLNSCTLTKNRCVGSKMGKSIHPHRTCRTPDFPTWSSSRQCPLKETENDANCSLLPNLLFRTTACSLRELHMCNSDNCTLRSLNWGQCL